MRCSQTIDLDIIGISKTHLVRDDCLSVPGYKWFGHNRTTLHKRALRRSGGAGWLIKDSIINNYNVSVIDSSYEGILWLEVAAKNLPNTILMRMAVCFLPPGCSSRHVNAAEFLDTLLHQVYEYQHNGITMISGDFNSRVGSLFDCIVGVDEIPPRNIIDTTTNGYCNFLLDFLFSAEFYLLNGRNFHNNDYTRVGSTCCSVVDYCLIPHEKLDLFTEFRITHARELFQSSGCVGEMDPRSGIPDHSLLSWHLKWIMNIYKRHPGHKGLNLKSMI